MKKMVCLLIYFINWIFTFIPNRPSAGITKKAQTNMEPIWFVEFLHAHRKASVPCDMLKVKWKTSYTPQQISIGNKKKKERERKK